MPLQIKGGWTGPARLNLVPNANAPVAQFPIKKVFPGKHLIADITLPYGRVLHDYMTDKYVSGGAFRVVLLLRLPVCGIVLRRCFVTQALMDCVCACACACVHCRTPHTQRRMTWR